MPQLFPRSANSLAKATVAGVPLLLTAVGAGLYAAGRSDLWTRAGEPLEQPVPFSHEHHVTGLGIDCRYCHASVETAAFAGMPATSTCLTCHSHVWKDAPVLEPLLTSQRTGKPLLWARVYDVPDHVYFNHSIHVKKGVGCATCHGRVDKMPAIRLEQPVTMRWCLDCHRHPANSLRPPQEVFNMAFESPGDSPETRRKLMEDQKVRREGLTDCNTCHQ